MSGQPEDPIEHVHRPLPSVDIPLLKEERRAARSRYMVIWTVVVLALGGVVAITAWGRLQTKDDHAAPADGLSTTVEGPPPADTSVAVDAPEANPLPAAPPTPTPAEVVGATPSSGSTTPTMLGAVERIPRSFGRARSFHHALLGLGLDEGTAQAIEASLTKLLDFRHCHAEDQLVLEKDERGTLLLFEYHASPTEYYRVERKGDGTYSAEKVSIPIERTRIRGGGTVTNSLGDALSNAGLGRSLAGIFTFALQRNVDFTTQTRSGDTFRIIVDEERIGDRFLGYGDVHALEYSGQRTGTSRAFWYASGKDDDGDFYDDTGRALHGGWLKTPLRFDHISSGFDPKRRHPILKRIMPHNGVDYAASRGTPVWAAADGVVTHAGPKGPNGNLVSIRHGNGYTTHYAHLERIQSGIKPGANVKQRQMIGTVGSTGRSTGPHLHFGLEKGGRFLDAVPVINGPGALLPAGDLAKFRAQQRRLASELERIPIQGRKPGVDTAASTAPTPESSTESPMD